MNIIDLFEHKPSTMALSALLLAVITWLFHRGIYILTLCSTGPQQDEQLFLDLGYIWIQPKVSLCDLSVPERIRISLRCLACFGYLLSLTILTGATLSLVQFKKGNIAVTVTFLAWSFFVVVCLKYFVPNLLLFKKLQEVETLHIIKKAAVRWRITIGITSFILCFTANEQDFNPLAWFSLFILLMFFDFYFIMNAEVVRYLHFGIDIRKTPGCKW